MFDALKSLYSKVADRSILSLFDDPNRAAAFSIRFDHMLFDYSKTNIDETARAALLDLARDRGVAQKRDAMFQGAKINDTEGRAVLHTALRNLDGDAVHVDPQDVMPEVLQTLTLMGDFAEAVRNGDFVGQGGAHYRCGEYRDRGIGFGSCDGDTGACPLSRWAQMSFCFQCGWGEYQRCFAGSKP